MRAFEKVAVVGTGLIGGSIALAMKKKRLCRRVIGISLHKESLDSAKRLGAVDEAFLSLEAIKDADLVILAMPVRAILKLAPKISQIVKIDCLVFDVASTKVNITGKLSGLFKFFVGAHPLAGSEKRGINFARPDLFLNSLCILTPLKNTDKSAVLKVKKLWTALGAKTLVMSPQRHDRILGFVSHLSHIAAFSLINSIPAQFLKFSIASLKESTRIASSDPRLWAEIVLDNRKNSLAAISKMQANLRQIKSALQSKSSSRLTGIFKKAKFRRDSLK
ncbi:MAG: prephenate dehydrogenase/arogenate dehydrogenase family protein [Candidatus Omnitrophica bacterium]|nr:prephenate dehydrogenase/arogenate dehydrogenase family protein [Candidatus Omnitrophota bacterium]